VPSSPKYQLRAISSLLDERALLTSSKSHDRFDGLSRGRVSSSLVDFFEGVVLDKFVEGETTLKVELNQTRNEDIRD
jgi:hypothetical protein